MPPQLRPSAGRRSTSSFLFPLNKRLLESPSNLFLPPGILQISFKFGSASRRLPQSSLHGRIERAEKSRPILLDQRRRPPSVRSQFAQVPGYLTTGERISDTRFCPFFSARGDDPHPLFEASGCQRDVGGNAHVHGPGALGKIPPLGPIPVGATPPSTGSPMVGVVLLLALGVGAYFLYHRLRKTSAEEKQLDKGLTSERWSLEV